MDPVTIATIASGAVSALVPFLKKGGERLVDKVVEEGFAERGKIWSAIKGLFVDEDLTTLDLFAENPEDKEKQAELKGELKHLLKAKPEVAGEIEEWLKKIPAVQKTNTMTITGDDNQAFQDVSGSTITVNKN